MNQDLQAIGVDLKTFRKQKGMTQSQVATATGIARPIVSNIERGQFVGAIATLQKYLLLANFELHTQEKPHEYPQLGTLEQLFGEDG